ncbi:uncharacterized protein [Periplaneta americana]|uniref:uncharacterized protein isoform X1 n=1 Tax=Periplaneta americana TaxID=6978 RepID=UPI0037E7FCAF
MDFSAICRFCMAKDVPMCNITHDISIQIKASSLLPNLKLLDERFPNHICKNCLYQLNAAYKFKKKCEKTDIILRQHLRKGRASTGPVVSTKSSNPPEEIQIDSDDDEDANNIAEPLVVLSSNANLEDQDPLDLGHEENQSLYDADSSHIPVPRNNVQNDDVVLSRSDKPLNSNGSQTFSIHLQQSGMMRMKNNNGIFQVPHEQDSVTIERTTMGQSINSTRISDSTVGQSINSTHINDCTVEQSLNNTHINNSAGGQISVPEHFLNEGYEKMEYQNNTGERFKCPVCSAAFVSKYRMELHLSEHDGETPYICPLCKKGFGREGGLKAHLKLHSGERPHVCEVCNKAFSLKGNLKVHQRLHTGERPFQCTICMKAFTQKISLTKHLSIHKAAL